MFELLSLKNLAFLMVADLRMWGIEMWEDSHVTFLKDL